MQKNNKFKLKQTGLSRTISALLLTGLMATTAQAGKIVSGPSESSVPPNPEGFVAQGFGGWNLGNVEIVLNSGDPDALDDGDDSWFEENDGSYYFSGDSDHTYLGEVYENVSGGGLLGYVLAKDWPVGEPSGIKIVNDDPVDRDPKPQNCIMATSYLEDHFLDSTDPKQVLCSGPFQSHKRYKLAMLPTTVGGGTGSEKGIDLVFNVEAEEGSRDYQVFQKINNWTDGRLEGFKIEVGTGIGTDFKPASDASGVGIANLSLSVPEEIWVANQLANFSAGLFGPADPKHGRDAGFFDPVNSAGFSIAEYPNVSGETDTLHSNGTLSSSYVEVPTGATDQFGPWLADNMLPYGIFWDDDGNPETDAELLAWYGQNPNLPEDDVLNPNQLGWMTGSASNFDAVPSEKILDWGKNLEYTTGEIDDLVNVGLNYIVTVGNPGETFTIRITPKVDTSGAGVPAYYGETPEPRLQFLSNDGVVAISPSPVFAVGELLTLRVGDANPVLPVEVTVTSNAVSSDCTYTDTGGLTETVALIDQGEEGDNRGVYAATTDLFSNVDLQVGTKVTVIYTDTDGIGTEEVKCATTTASADGEQLPLVDVSIDFSAPASLFVGQTGKLSVTITSAKDSETAISGYVHVSGNNGVVLYDDTFSDLAPNRKLRIPTTWTASLSDPAIDPEVVEWTVTVDIDDQVEDIVATAFTEVSVKPGKDNNNGNNK